MWDLNGLSVEIAEKLALFNDMADPKRIHPRLRAMFP